jgi:bifunctional UDP-N-acetylglucosamine pyrophosphorylase/glucosamine-1-phosphate N-acetyltransferase
MSSSEFAVILAAGMGTRMQSAMAKVLHPICGRSLVGHVVAAARGAGLHPVIVLHHQASAVRENLGVENIDFVRQEIPRGTGDAVRAALEALPRQGTVIVMAGDAPLLRSETITALRAAHGDNAVTVLTARLNEPAAYGRLIRDAAGLPARIVEAREATPEQLAVNEINTGLYCFDIAWLRSVLPSLSAHDHKDEIYLTDTIEHAARIGRAGVCVHGDSVEVLGVNDRWDLAQARGIMQARIIEAHARGGVTFFEPRSTIVDVGVVLLPDCEIGPGVVLEGSTYVAGGARIRPHCVLVDTRVGEGVEVRSHTVSHGAVLESGVRFVGPMARLRPGTVLQRGARVGNFVEVKNATLAPGATVGHLAYVGDATVGENTNLGAGTITCNYDGFTKHRTEIGANVFVGSNTALVAPVTLGEGVIVGAGSVITRDVPADAVTLGRSAQVNKEGAASRFRSRKRQP